LYLVNPKYESIEGLPCYPSVQEVPEKADVAVIAVAARHVLPVLAQCADAGVKGAIIYTAGFAETGNEGQAEMRALARSTGMRIMGPNCVGLVNNATHMWTTFAQAPLFEERFLPQRPRHYFPERVFWHRHLSTGGL
jgi:acetate---CoA ligase (ADP-forming)